MNKKLVCLTIFVVLIAGSLVFLKTRVSNAEPETGMNRVPRETSFSKNPEGRERTEWLSKVERAETSDLQALMEAALKIDDARLRDLIVTAVMTRWIAEDSDTMLAFLDHLEVSLSKDALAVFYGSLQSVLTKLDPELALTDNVLLLVERLVSYFSDTDPERALVWAEKWLLDDTLENALVSIVRGTARSDIARAFEITEEITSPLRRMQALAAVGTQWAGFDKASAIAWAKTLENPGERALTMNSVLLVVAQNDPWLAANELASVNARLAAEFKRSRREILAENNITEADEANAIQAYMDLLNNGAIPGPESPDLELMVEAAKVIAAKIAAVDPAASIAWTASLDGLFLKNSSLSSALDAWSASDPLAAVNHVKQNNGEDLLLLESVFKGWASTDPLAAASTAATVSDANQRVAVLNSVFGTWSAGKGASDAAEYLRSMPASQVTDSMKLSVSQGLIGVAPLEAWNVAATIRNPDTQARAFKAALSALVFSDIAGAVAVYDSTAMPEETRSKLGEVLESVGAK